MKTKVKIIETESAGALEKEINDFLALKGGFDIKINVIPLNRYGTEVMVYTALIRYNVIEREPEADFDEVNSHG